MSLCFLARALWALQHSRVFLSPCVCACVRLVSFEMPTMPSRQSLIFPCTFHPLTPSLPLFVIFSPKLLYIDALCSSHQENIRLEPYWHTPAMRDSLYHYNITGFVNDPHKTIWRVRMWIGEHGKEEDQRVCNVFTSGGMKKLWVDQIDESRGESALTEV